MTIFLPLKCLTVFFSIELLIGNLKTLPLEIGRIQMGKSTYVMGWRGSYQAYVYVQWERGWGQILAILVRTY